MSETIIELESVSLRYRLAKHRVADFKDYLIQMVKGSLTYEELWALNSIDLRVTAGESVGIVGPNGAGKSTLAKVIAGVLKPHQGRRSVRGRISPILELGTGFDFELTGLENIYLNGLLLGNRRREIDQKIDDILEFSGLQDFVHSPMRMYSSGMVARLGFSIATAWIPDVLILDEVLAVGDVRFLARCQERLRTFREAGATVLMISHSPNAIQQYCDRCVWIDHGKVVEDGKVDEVLAVYAESMSHGEGESFSTAEPQVDSSQQLAVDQRDELP